MKKFFPTKDEGFTLVELMVVVAIIGILSAVGVPQFKKYQAKSKQSEAKIQLAALYTTEVNSLSEYDAYGTCLIGLGFEQPPKGYYRIGFNAGFDLSSRLAGCTAGAAGAASNNTSGVTAAAAFNNFNMSPLIAVTAVAGTHVTAISTGTAVVNNTANPQTFVAAAEGNITTRREDRWTINQAKTLSNTQVGY